jgi:hypothetical protein
LLESGANPNLPDDFTGETPLQLVEGMPDNEIASILKRFMGKYY